MKQIKLFEDTPEKNKNCFCLDSGLTIEFFGGLGKKARRAVVFQRGQFFKEIKPLDKAERKLLIVELVKMDANQTKLAAAFGISRMTINTYVTTKEQFGIEGLLRGYRPEVSKDIRKQRALHREQADPAIPVNKAKALAELRAQTRAEQAARQLPLDFSFGGQEDKALHLPTEEQPFSEEHDWEPTRYAGVFVYLPTLVKGWDWLRLVAGYFGEAYKTLLVFLLMAGLNIRSIEQMKHVRAREAGVTLGIRRIGCRQKLWEWFYDAAGKEVTGALLQDYFRYQIRAGLVGCGQWFTDGHLLPYTGKYHVRCGYNTQRRMPVPGRTNMVTCDSSGRVVDFEIQEGKGDLRERIVALKKKWADETALPPVMVFDREGRGDEFFANLVKETIPFVTWENRVDAKKLAAIRDSEFATEFTYNDKHYGVFEEEKRLRSTFEQESNKKTVVTIKRIYVWNKTSNRRTCGLAWTASLAMSTEDCTRAILSRWGASENAFKHLNNRHPLHYHPGFKLVESERQDIANPEIKKKDTLISQLKAGLDKLYKKLAKAKQAVNADGALRQNSTHERTRNAIAEQEAELATAREEKKHLPERVDVSSLGDYKSFKKIDDEGKYLFDFVTSSAWNGRKQMVEWLQQMYDDENDVVDLFYAITHCHGWIKSTRSEVTVRLEPLQQPKRRQAQEQLCRKLTHLAARTLNGKRLVVEVGNPPSTETVQKN